MYELIIVCLWGLVVIGGLAAVNVSERKQWVEERKDLLNRIMSRDYREFAAAAKTEEKVHVEPIRVVSIDDLKRDLEEERGPLGMPV